jgi:carbonic anhydrase/acetyltransferase-like protein (isoleucine patch superfamily)
VKESPKIDSSVFVSGSAYIVGSVQIGENLSALIQSVLMDNSKVPKRPLIIGVPAGIKKNLNRKEIERIISASRSYVELSRGFKKQRL